LNNLIPACLCSTAKKHHNLDVQAWQKLMEKEQKETEELSNKFKAKMEQANVG
jgi:hypothetical protein